MNTQSTPCLLALALGLGAMAPRTMAGDREWAVAGKVLTGIAAASVVARILDPVPCAGTTAVVYQQPAVYVVAPPPPIPVVVAPAPVVAFAPVAPPAPVAYAVPSPTVVYATPPVVYAAPPVLYAAPPVYVAPAPVVIPPPVFVHRRPRWGFHGHVVFRP